MRNARPAAIGAIVLLAASCSVSVATTTTRPNTESGPASPAAGSEAKVVRVIDGDSLELEIEGEVIEARLAGVNAPELFSDANRRTCNGEQAKTALEDLVSGGKVSVGGTETDRFGRLLVELSVDGVSVSDSLIADGWLLVSDDKLTRRQQVRAAASSGAGMFGETCGAAETTLRISSIRADPAGNDRENLTDELVELTNRSEIPVDTGGWVLRDETTGHIFKLDPLVLGPGKKVRVRTGSGTNTDSDIYLNETFPVWSNDFETVLLIDPKGVVADVVFLIEVGE